MAAEERGPAVAPPEEPRTCRTCGVVFDLAALHGCPVCSRRPVLTRVKGAIERVERFAWTCPVEGCHASNYRELDWTHEDAIRSQRAHVAARHPEVNERA